MSLKTRTHLMFDGVAEEAMTLYAAIFPASNIIELEKYGPGEPGAEGAVKRALFSLAGQEIICIDSPVKHEFSFTPSMSIFVDCESETEQRELFERLSEAGSVMMPLDDYGFSRRFGWLSDRYGVSWQLNLP